MGDLIYSEKLTSNRTIAFFLALTCVFLTLLAWRVSRNRMDGRAIVFLCSFCLFLYYTLNYRSLHTRLTAQTLDQDESSL